jgi:hypothetical protein
MKKAMMTICVCALALYSAFAAVPQIQKIPINSWIGTPYTGVANCVLAAATIKGISVDWDGNVRFTINETNGTTVDANTGFIFDGKQAWGKNMLGALLAAQTSGTPICFQVLSRRDVQWNGVDHEIYYVYPFIIGSNLF